MAPPVSAPSGALSSELLFRYLEQTNEQKFKQEKIDHAGPAGNSYMGKMVGWLLFREPWNEHFQETRPQTHREERHQAIETLQKTMQEEGHSKVEDALSSLKKTGHVNTVKILKEDLNIDRWIEVANANTGLERSRILSKAANDYRVGKWPGFWDFNVIPCPRLGSGSWWDRAQHLRNWSWGKSPDILLALTINNYLAMVHSDLDKMDQEGRSLILLAQLPVSDQKSFGEIMEKVRKGEVADLQTARNLVDRAPITSEGKQYLLDRMNKALQVADNVRLLQEINSLPLVQSLATQEDQENFHQFLYAYMQGKMDDQKTQTYLSSMFPPDEASILLSYLHRMTVMQPLAEDKGLETLFREAQLGERQSRLREIFDKENPTVAEIIEFQDLLTESNLSSGNKSLMHVLFYCQEESRIAQAAKKELWDILGSPQKIKNPSTGKDEWDPRSVGNLHNGILITVDRAVGLGIFTAPTWGMAGVGGALSLGIRRFLNKGFNPWWGAAAGAAFGTLFNFSPSGVRYREPGADVMKTPYRPWSDLAVADMPAEGLGLYLDAAGGAKVTEGMTGARHHLHLFEKLGIIIHTPPALVRGFGFGWLGLIAADSLDGVWRPTTPLMPKFGESLDGSSSSTDGL
jgi:hypothetical protein